MIYKPGRDFITISVGSSAEITLCGQSVKASAVTSALEVKNEGRTVTVYMDTNGEAQSAAQQAHCWLNN